MPVKTTSQEASEQGIVGSVNLVGISIHFQPRNFALLVGTNPAGSVRCAGWLLGHNVPLFDFWDSFALSD